MKNDDVEDIALFGFKQPGRRRNGPGVAPRGDIGLSHHFCLLVRCYPTLSSAGRGRSPKALSVRSLLWGELILP